MSHEIRTPINSIIGMNEIILRDCKDETIRGYAEDVKSANQYLLSLVNDILDYSKIQAGKMEIVPIEYNMSDLLKRVSKLIQYRVAEKDLEFVFLSATRSRLIRNIAVLSSHIKILQQNTF